MSYLIDDDFNDAEQSRQEPTKQQFNQLKAYIKKFVKDRGHRAETSEVCKACHVQFPGLFTWGELEAACAELNSDWAAKRAAKAEAKANGGTL